VKRPVLVYGVCGGLLIAVLKLVEYRFLAVEHSLQIYGGLIALIFAVVGIRLGQTLTRRHDPVPATDVPRPASPVFIRDTAKLAELGITPRELEILERIADGMSTKEIAAALFVSENTVKTHASRLFDKLDVSRRTQAVQVARQLGLLP